MAWQIPISNSGPGIRADLGDGLDDLYVGSQVIVASTTTGAVEGTGSNHEVRVYGTIASTTSVIFLGNDETVDSGNKVFVAQGGRIDSFGSFYCIFMSSFNSDVENHGAIRGGGGVSFGGISASTDSSLINTGTIEGFDVGISHNNSETLVVTNSGLITSGDPSRCYESFSATALDLITNTGRMVGDILLGGGNDIYNGAAGRCTGGEIYGQAGNDLIAGGIDNDQIFGGTENDTLVGGAGHDTLDGGTGNDALRGGSGNDTYVIDSSGDRVNEALAGSNGVDTVQTTLSLGLTNTTILAGQIENLTLLGAANLNGLGNAVANTIIGNSGSNILAGLAGNDRLTGGAGNDFFRFNTAPSAANRDVITDFTVANDTIQLENAVYTAVGAAGVLAAAAFRTGAGAADANDRIIYNPANGALIYDTNGNSAGGAVQFATISGGLAISNADFVVI